MSDDTTLNAEEFVDAIAHDRRQADEANRRTLAAEARVSVLEAALREWLDAHDHLNDDAGTSEDRSFWREVNARAAVRALLVGEPDG